MAKHGNRQRKTLVCTETGQKTYRTEKNIKNTTERLELKKYNPILRRHTIYKEEK